FPSSQPARDRALASLSFSAPAALQTPPALPELDVSIVTRNSAQWLPAFFRSLLAQGYPTHRLHLKIVDDGSSDGSRGLLSECIERSGRGFASVSFASEANLGDAAGHNRALAHGSAAWCLVTRVDLEFGHDSIVRLASCALGAGDRVAAVEARQSPCEHPKAY